MTFQVQATAQYTATEKSSLILQILAAHPTEETISIDPGTIPYRTITEGLNRMLVINLDGPSEVTIRYQAGIERNYQLVDLSNNEEDSIGELLPEIIPFLHPSRYCQSDLFGKFAADSFGHHATTFQKVLAISQWINTKIDYVTGSSTGTTTAADTLIQRTGVCRDFAHLGITFCRALNIPARYCCVYAYMLEPQDFHACFEAYIGGQWIIFDATGLAPLNGLLKIATGRDAADTAVASLYGEIEAHGLEVFVSCVSDNFQPVYYDPMATTGISIA